jgi:NitT/TauT family transport system substrate-binding protein
VSKELLIMRVFSAACLALVLACAPARAQQPAPEKPALTLAVGGKTLIAYLPLTIADRLGLFEKEGLKVEINDFQGGSRALQSVVAGSADVTCGAYEHTILTRAKGVGIKAVALQNNSFGAVIALPTEKAKAYRGPKDLVGLKIGVTAPGSASSLAVALLLAKDGLTLDKVSIVGVGGGASAVAAMKSGQIDAISNFDPSILILESEGVITPVVDTRTAKGLDYLYGGPFAGSSFYMRDDFIAKNPNTTQAFVNAVVKAVRWLQTASVDQIVEAVPPDYYGGDKARYAKMVTLNRPAFAKDGRIELAMAERTWRALAAHEELLKTAKIDLKDTFDNSFADKANAALH